MFNISLPLHRKQEVLQVAVVEWELDRPYYNIAVVTDNVANLDIAGWTLTVFLKRSALFFFDPAFDQFAYTVVTGRYI